MNPVKTAQENPNAAVAGSTTGAGIGVVWLLGYAGVDLTPELGALIAGGATTAALFLGRHGIRGFLRMIWRGNGT